MPCSKKKKGITLIALVITIILLLILVGVTLKIVIDEGFVDKTQIAVDKYSRAQARENLEIASETTITEDTIIKLYFRVVLYIQ